MPKATRSIEQIEEVRERIIQSALDILEHEGYDSLSMSKLGALVSMSAANLYNYYANKDELLIAIHKKAFAMLYEHLVEALKGGTTPADRFKMLVDAYVAFGTGNVNLYDIMFNRPIPQYSDYIGTPQEALSCEEYNSSIRTLALASRVMKDYAETRPELRDVDPRFMTIKFMSALHGIISLHNSGILMEMGGDADTLLKSIVDEAVKSITG